MPREIRSDPPKPDKRLKRYDKARAIDHEIDKWCIDHPTKTMAQAKETVAPRHGHNSGKALDKWLRRNRRLPPGCII